MNVPERGTESPEQLQRTIPSAAGQIVSRGRRFFRSDPPTSNALA